MPILGVAAVDVLGDVGAITPATQAKMLEVLQAAHQAGHDVPKVWGYVPTSLPEHNVGRAVDFMVFGNQAMGDWIAAYLWANRQRLQLRWILWRQSIRSTTPGKSGEWETMADRGSPTANHEDHVHAFFDDPKVESMIHGVDISSHQPNWQPAPDDTFAIIKATEGQSYLNPLLREQADRADNAGLVVGFYHFLWPERDRGKADGTVTTTPKVSGSPEVQAAWFVQSITDIADEQDLYFVDWEHAGSFTKGQPGGYASFAEKNRFIAEFKRLLPGRKIGLYVNAYMWKASDKQPGDMLWLAEYAAKPTIVEPFVFWQYSDKTSTGQSLDQNVANFETVQALRDWITPPPNPQEPDMALSQEDIYKIAAAVWGSKAADVVPAPDANVTNPDWLPASYLRNIYLLVREVRDLVKKLK